MFTQSLVVSALVACRWYLILIITYIHTYARLQGCMYASPGLFLRKILECVGNLHSGMWWYLSLDSYYVARDGGGGGWEDRRDVCYARVRGRQSDCVSTVRDLDSD